MAKPNSKSSSSGNDLKRKRSKAKEPPKKRAKSETRDDEDDLEERILLDEQAVLESKKNYNKIKHLLDIAQDAENNHGLGLVAAVSLCRIFIHLLAAGSLSMRKGLSNKDAVVVEWLKRQLSSYEDVVLQILGEEERATSALTLALRLLKAEGQHLGAKDEYNFPTIFLTKIVKVLFYAPIGDDVRQEFAQKYMQKYQDVRFFSFQAIEAILSSGKDYSEPDILFKNAFVLLRDIGEAPQLGAKFDSFYLPAPPKRRHDLYSVGRLKRHSQAAWLALMALATTKSQRKQLLDGMVKGIVPWFSSPERLSDFLTDCYDAGGSLSLLALSGVFYLIQEKNLDYPSFYTKLYSLLTVDMVHSKHRSRFLRLLDTFLASSHLPAALVASFIKRLSRLALFAPPGAIIAIVPLIYNLFQRHPQTTFLMHREIRDPETQQLVEENGFEDLFDADETDPMETNAIESCIWEIVQLQQHYHPNVATIAKIISEQFTKQSYNMEDFLDHSYLSLIDAELSKEIKKPPAVQYFIPKRIFTRGEGEPPPNVLHEFWDFSEDCNDLPPTQPSA